MNLNIANCPRCGRIFSKGIRDVCINCQKEIEQEYTRCVEFLRDNRGATIYEVSDATGVSVRQITRFIREGRISMMNMQNLSYPCESCGTLIRQGNLCEECRNRLTKQVKKVTESAATKEFAERTDGGRTHSGYKIKSDDNNHMKK
jgi:flagellar operon protein (TIGR03826 family)